VTVTPVAGLLLAAGAGRRLGRPKALLEVGGEVLVERGVRTLRAGGCSPVVVVLGAAHEEVTARADLVGADVVVNADWASGMGSSLRAGIAALPPAAAAVVVALVDQPGVGPGAVQRLAGAAARGVAVAVATYDGRRGHPVLLARPTWPEVARLAHGDAGARRYLLARPELVTEIPCEGTGTPDDIDTAEDLARLRAVARLAPDPAPGPRSQ
jgi:CTP:molybdopterin cytidylyltransferase MocA